MQEKETTNNLVKIESYYGGWSIWIDGKQYSYDHNDPDMGTQVIKEILEDLGKTVKLHHDAC